MIENSKQWAFVQLVLADDLYGESGCGFINVLYELKLDLSWRSVITRGLVTREQTVRAAIDEV